MNIPLPGPWKKGCQMGKGVPLSSTPLGFKNTTPCWMYVVCFFWRFWNPIIFRFPSDRLAFCFSGHFFPSWEITAAGRLAETAVIRWQVWAVWRRFASSASHGCWRWQIPMGFGSSQLREVVSWVVFPYVFSGGSTHFNVNFSDFSETGFVYSRIQDNFFRSQRLHLFPLSISFKVEIIKGFGCFLLRFNAVFFSLEEH